MSTGTTNPKSIFHYQINDYSSPSGWQSGHLFDINYSEPRQSPLDTFLDKIGELNRLILDPRDTKSEIARLSSIRKISNFAEVQLLLSINNTNQVSPVFANLILLGFISAVESYFREIIRRIVLNDPESGKACEVRTVAYGAAIYHKKNMLPEALLETISFIDKDKIKKDLKDFLGIKGGAAFPTTVDEALMEYENVCQLRHCIVHRFGKLGANNAIKLGLDIHSKFLEKPILLNYNSLQTVSQICTNVAKEVNQFLWSYLMMRLIADPTNATDWKRKNNLIPWTWTFSSDKKKFKVYYDIFASRTLNVTHSLIDAYNTYKQKFRSL